MVIFPFTPLDQLSQSKSDEFVKAVHLHFYDFFLYYFGVLLIALTARSKSYLTTKMSYTVKLNTGTSCFVR